MDSAGFLVCMMVIAFLGSWVVTNTIRLLRSFLKVRRAQKELKHNIDWYEKQMESVIDE